LNKGEEGVKLDLKIKTGSSSDHSKERIDISGICRTDGQVGFVKIVVAEKIQAEGYWLKNSDGSYSLEQVVKDASVYVPDKLATTLNKDHVVVPDTDNSIRFLKRIVDINDQVHIICC
jgi:hypothetical protein